MLILSSFQAPKRTVRRPPKYTVRKPHKSTVRLLAKFTVRPPPKCTLRPLPKRVMHLPPYCTVRPPHNCTLRLPSYHPCTHRARGYRCLTTFSFFFVKKNSRGFFLFLHGKVLLHLVFIPVGSRCCLRLRKTGARRGGLGDGTI